MPVKGSSGKFAVDKAIEFVKEVGDEKEKIIMKTDQEPSIKYFVKDFLEARDSGRTVVEESLVGSSGSNGVVERSVGSLEGQIRAIFLGLGERLQLELDPRLPIVAFIPEYAAYLLNRLEVGKDGRTAYERVKGKKATVLGVEFGEKLLCKVKFQGAQAKIEARWEPGIFVGVRQRSGEMWVSVKGKVFAVRSVRRLPVDERWGPDCVKWVDRVPWNKYKDAEDADGEVPEEMLVEPISGESRGTEDGVVVIQTRKVPPRQFHIRKDDAERHGYTRGCAGCSSWFRGSTRQPHSEACRNRFRELLKDEAKFQNAEARRKEFVEKELRRKERKDEKKKKRNLEGEEEVAGGVGIPMEAEGE